jgi:hypothetical protein
MTHGESLNESILTVTHFCYTSRKTPAFKTVFRVLEGASGGHRRPVQKLSKTAIERPGMKRRLKYAEEGDTVVVWRLTDWAGH